MIDIITPTFSHARQLNELATLTFLQSHGNSASKKDIGAYVEKYFTEEVFQLELTNPQFLYKLLYQNSELIAYSKLILNEPHNLIVARDVCKMERLYVLERGLGQNIGKLLFENALEVAKQNKQSGVWLNVWTQNLRAIAFYEKQGFVNVGNTYFKISDTHSNPNYCFYLKL